MFVVGYASSMLLGTPVGSLADVWGRKSHCMLLCFLYATACVCLHSSSLPVLVAGRVVSGISTSILTSAPEAWMLHEHRRRGFPEPWIAHTAGAMSLLRGVTAIAAGLIAAPLASRVGPVGAFDASAATLMLAAAAIAALWTENVGGGAERRGAGAGGHEAGEERVGTEEEGRRAGGGAWLDLSSLRAGWAFVSASPEALLLGIISTGFESAMYLFVFSWSPRLRAAADAQDALQHRTWPQLLGQLWSDGGGGASGAPSPPPSLAVPFGVVFATFMAALMAGAPLVQLALRAAPSTAVLAATLAGASGALALAAAAPADALWPSLLFFCLFEISCGAYFPLVSTLRGAIVAEHVQATVAALFRVGLNAVVVLVLVGLPGLAPAYILAIAAALLAAAAVANQFLRTRLDAAADAKID
jgi:hypothetical protein